jgi:hypothetical protein
MLLLLLLPTYFKKSMNSPKMVRTIKTYFEVIDGNSGASVCLAAVPAARRSKCRLATMYLTSKQNKQKKLSWPTATLEAFEVIIIA